MFGRKKKQAPPPATAAQPPAPASAARQVTAQTPTSSVDPRRLAVLAAALEESSSSNSVSVTPTSSAPSTPPRPTRPAASPYTPSYTSQQQQQQQRPIQRNTDLPDAFQRRATKPPPPAPTHSASPSTTPSQLTPESTPRHSPNPAAAVEATRVKPQARSNTASNGFPVIKSPPRPAKSQVVEAFVKPIVGAERVKLANSAASPSPPPPQSRQQSAVANNKPAQITPPVSPNRATPPPLPASFLQRTKQRTQQTAEDDTDSDYTPSSTPPAVSPANRQQVKTIIKEDHEPITTAAKVSPRSRERRTARKASIDNAEQPAITNKQRSQPPVNSAVTNKINSQFQPRTFSESTFDSKLIIDRLTAEQDEVTREISNRMALVQQLRTPRSTDNNDLATPAIESNGEPYLELFTTAKSHLQQLQQHSKQKLHELVNEVEDAQRYYNTTINEIDIEMKTLHSNYQSLEQRLQQAYQHAKGAALLSKLNTKRRNILRGKQLLSLYSICCTGDASQLPPMFQSSYIHASSTGVHELFELADIVLHLSTVIHEMITKQSSTTTNNKSTNNNSTTSSSLKQAQKLVTTIITDIETELLERFEKSVLDDDLENMQQFASVLLRFHGKQIIQRYCQIVLNDILLQSNAAPSARTPANNTKQHRSESEDGGDSQDDDDDDDEHDTSISPTIRQFSAQLDKLYKSINSTVVEELDAIPRIFSASNNPANGIANTLITLKANQPITGASLTNTNVIQALRTLFDAIFTQVIGKFLGANLLDNKQLSKDEYLQLLYIAYRRTNKLLTTLTTSLTSITGNTPILLTVINLKMLFNSVFERYIDTYKQQEISTLLDYTRHLYQHIVELGHMADDTNAVHITEFDLLNRQKNALITQNKQLWVTRSLQCESVMDKVIDRSNDSITRMKILCEEEELPAAVYDLYSALTQSLMSNYLLSLYTEVEHLYYPPAEPKDESPSIILFDIIRLYNDLIQQYQLFYHHTVVPRLLVDGNILAVSDQKHREYFTQIEQRIVNGLHRMLTSTIYYIQRVLARQPSAVYRPGDERVVFDSDDVTPVCSQVCDVIQSHYEAVVPNLDGVNLDRYVTAFGLKFYHVLQEHLQHFTVTPLGATVFSRDIKAYDLLIRQFHLPTINQKFEVLKAAASIYYVSIENLQSLLTSTTEGGLLMSLPTDELSNFLKMRSDYTQQRPRINNILQLQA